MPTTANATLREFREQWREFNLQLLQNTTTDEVPRNTLRERESKFESPKTLSHCNRGNLEHSSELSELLQLLHTIDEILFANLDVTSAVSAWAIAHIALYSKQQTPLREALQVAAYSAESLEEQVLQALSVDILDYCVKESAPRDNG